MKPGCRPSAAQTETKEKTARESLLKNQFSAARASSASTGLRKQSKAFSSTAHSNAVSGDDLAAASESKKRSGPASDERKRIGRAGTGDEEVRISTDGLCVCINIPSQTVVAKSAARFPVEK